MNISTIDNQEVYYLDIPNDPVVEMLGRNKLYGQVLYNLVEPYLSQPSTILDIGSNFGTFALVPATKGHSVLMVESREIMSECLHKTFTNYPNVSISQNIPQYPLKNVRCINFFRKNTLLQDIQDCHEILNSNQPVLLINVDIPVLQNEKIKLSDIFETLKSLGYHGFLYNAPNFYLYIDESSPFPFCEMVIIGLNQKTIIEKLGHITFGSHLPDELISDLIEKNLNNTQAECLDYLNSLKKTLTN